MRVAKDDTASTFFTTPRATLGGPGTGLSTALEVLQLGFVIVGSVPSADGTTATSGPGSLLVIDGMGNVRNNRAMVMATDNPLHLPMPRDDHDPVMIDRFSPYQSPRPYQTVMFAPHAISLFAVLKRTPNIGLAFMLRCTI